MRTAQIGRDLRLQWPQLNQGVASSGFSEKCGFSVSRAHKTWYRKIFWILTRETTSDTRHSSGTSLSGRGKMGRERGRERKACKKKKYWKRKGNSPIPLPSSGLPQWSPTHFDDCCASWSGTHGETRADLGHISHIILNTRVGCSLTVIKKKEKQWSLWEDRFRF